MGGNGKKKGREKEPTVMVDLPFDCRPPHDSWVLLLGLDLKALSIGIREGQIDELRIRLMDAGKVCRTGSGGCIGG